MNYYSLALILHIIASSVIIGVNFFVIYATLKKSIVKEVLSILEGLHKLMPVFLILILGSGYFLYKTGDFIGNNLFWVKIGLFVLDLFIIGVLVQRRIKAAKDHTEASESYSKTLIFRLISMGLLILIVTLGVLI